MRAIGKLEMDLDYMDAFFHALKWFLFTVITLGFGAFLYPYALVAFCLNRVHMVGNDGKRRRFACDLAITSRIGHALIWFVFAWITLGLAYFIYLYRVGKFVAEHTQVVEG